MGLFSGFLKAIFSPITSIFAGLGSVLSLGLGVGRGEKIANPYAESQARLQKDLAATNAATRNQKKIKAAQIQLAARGSGVSNLISTVGDEKKPRRIGG